jgi:hypothetical protein
LRAGSQFREKAQRYHNPILSNRFAGSSRLDSDAECHLRAARRSMEGMTPIC